MTNALSERLAQRFLWSSLKRYFVQGFPCKYETGMNWKENAMTDALLGRLSHLSRAGSNTLCFPISFDIAVKKCILLTKYYGYNSIHYMWNQEVKDTMVSIKLNTPYEITALIAKKAKEKRLGLNLTQKSLANQSGVSFGVIKKFERTGKISLESLLKLALVLDALGEFENLFNSKSLESYRSLDHILKQKSRKRGRR